MEIKKSYNYFTPTRPTALDSFPHGLLYCGKKAGDSMNIVKIFLASSIVEFEQERDKLAARIRGLNNKYVNNDIYFQLDICEDYSDALTHGRKQEEYNDLIRECHFFFALIGANVGQFTLEEINVAREQFKKNGSALSPKIVVFFQKLPTEAQSAEVIRLKDELRESYPPEFEHVSEVTRDIYFELADGGAFFDAAALEAGRVEHGRLLARIAENRQKIKALKKSSHGEITEENQYDLAPLYQENAELAKAALSDWEEIYDCAFFWHKLGYHLKAIKAGADLEAFKARYVPDEEPDDRAALQNLLGDCYAALERYEDAETRYRAALEIYRPLAEAEPDEYSPDLAETCVKLAEICAKTYRFEAAERLYREALACYLRDWEAYAAEIAEACRAALGVMGQELDGASDVWRIDVRRAEEAEILRTAEEAFAAYWECGEEATEEAEAARDKLSHWLDAFPCPDTAAALMTKIEAKAWELTQDTPEDYKRALSKICFSEANWLRVHNHMEPAETLARKSLEICRELQENDNIAASCNLLATILSYINRPNETEQHYQESIEIVRKLAQQDPTAFEPALAINYNNLANLLYQTKRYAEAEKRHRKALEIQRKLARQDPTQFEPGLARSCYNLANLLRNMKRYGEAEIFCREALKIRRKLARQDPATFDPALAMSCSNMANLLRHTGRHEEAEEFFREALEIYRRLAAQDPAQFEPDLASTCYNYGALLLYGKGEPATALAYFDEAIALLEKYPHYENLLNDAKRARRDCLGYPGTLTI